MRSKPNRALAEAATWFRRLNEASISTEAVLEFRQWRVQPGNAEAYQNIETAWGKTGTIANSPESQAMVSEVVGRDRRKAKFRRRVRIGGLAGGLAALAIGVIGGPPLLRQFDQPTYGTTVGQQRLVALPDGSSIRLDTDSKIRVHYTANARDVELLRGRALFDIVHTANRPMTVRVGETTVRDLGTRFIVGDYITRVSVTVLSGSVQVIKAGAPNVPQVLRPGQGVAVTATVGAPAAVDVASVASWTTGRLVFNDLPLTTAVLDMNRYDQRKILLDPSAADLMHVSGTYQTGDPDRFAAALKEIYGLKVSVTENGDVLLSGPGNAPATK